MKTLPLVVANLWTLTLLGCATHPAPEPSTPSAVEAGNADADQAIAIVRAGIDAVGGLERWRLTQGKLTFESEVEAGGRVYAMRTVRAAADRTRLEYLDTHLTYLYEGESCRRRLFGVQTDCNSDEAQWATALRVVSALRHPSSDIAGLGVSMRTKPAAGPGLSTVELRPTGTNLRLLASYGVDRRLAAVSLAMKAGGAVQTQWRFEFGDYRDIDGLSVAHTRRVSKDGQLIWSETIRELQLGEADERVFQPPMPPILGRVFVVELPKRALNRSSHDTLLVEGLVVPECPGGALSRGAAQLERSAEPVMALIHKGAVAELPGIIQSLEGQLAPRKAVAAGPAAVLRLDQAEPTEEAGLFLVYQPVVKTK